MWVIILEAALALTLLLLIVWVTLPKRRRDSARDKDRVEDKHKDEAKHD